MNLLNPAALIWAGLAIPIVVFYILKIRLRREPVSTILFWREIFEEKQPRSIWEKLRHLLSLLIQLAFLMLVVFALTEPIFRWEVREARRLVLVVNNSAGMSATDLLPSRLERAKDEGKTLIDRLRFRDEMAIISAGTQPQVRCGLTGHQSTLRSTLAAVPPTEGPTRVKEAVELARRLLADQSSQDARKQTVVILSDGCFDDVNSLAKAADVRLITVGGPAGNVGITRFQVRRSLIDPIGYQILAEVTNASDTPVETRLEIDLDDNAVNVVPLKLAAGGRFHKVFEKTSAEGGRLVAKINHADALPVNNQAWALLPRRETPRVSLVTSGNLFLEKVFEANPLVNLSRTKELPKDLPAGGLTVFHKNVPAKLPAGSVLVIEPAGACDLWEIGETLQNPIVTKQEKDSPLMAHVRLDNVLMPEARQLKLSAPKAQVLATALSGDPIFAAIERPSGKVLVLTVNLDKGDLPLQTAFPIMVANALGWFAGTKGELRESLATGTVADLELPPGLPAGTQTLSLRAPDGKTRVVPVVGNKVTVGPLDRVGVWSLVGADAGATTTTKAGDAPKPLLEVACNLANRQESDLRTPKGLATAPTEVTAGFGGWPIWFSLVVLAWALVGLEWYLYQRRWIS